MINPFSIIASLGLHFCTDSIKPQNSLKVKPIFNSEKFGICTTGILPESPIYSIDGESRIEPALILTVINDSSPYHLICPLYPDISQIPMQKGLFYNNQTDTHFHGFHYHSLLIVHLTTSLISKNACSSVNPACTKLVFILKRRSGRASKRLLSRSVFGVNSPRRC